MTEIAGAPTTFRALLIGADFYFPNAIPSGATYASLSGAVRDVTRVEQMLRSRVPAPIEIVKLTASNLGGARPPEPESAWPTYANITTALEALFARTAPGDQVYIHYSGHGGRVPTKWPEKKGKNGVDETLVPIDVGDRSVRHVRDLDLAFHVERLVREKQAVVTLVLDSCHSGGATRGSLVRRCATMLNRSAEPDDLIDTTARPEDGVAPDEALHAAWNRLGDSGSRQRGVTATRWLPDAAGYVLLAASRDVEAALEGSFDDGTSGGLLTSAYLRALEHSSAAQPWRTLYDAILANVKAQRVPQTPQLLGEAGREVLGTALRSIAQTAIVIGVDGPARRVKLDTGRVTGIGPGATFTIFRAGTIDFASAEDRVGTAIVALPMATTSWATLDAGARIEYIELGAPARYEGESAATRCRSVAIVHRDDLPAEIDQAALLAAVTDAVATRGRGLLEVCTSGAPHYRIMLDAAGSYVLADATGAPIPNVGAIPASPASLVVDRLLHLIRYQTLLAIEDPASSLAQEIHVQLCAPPLEWTAKQPPQGGTPLALEGDAHLLAPDQWVFVRVRNDGARSVNMVALDFADDWGIAAVEPSPPPGRTIPTERYRTIAPESDWTFALRTYLPPDRSETLDVIKLFFTIADTELWWVLCPPIDDLGTRSASASSDAAATSVWDQLRNALHVEHDTTRAVRPASSPSEAWSTRRIRLLTRKV
ncbi:Hypothetical protein A7982_02343 [Minicystis rosea]|nr:Hypothetical protein A7982_02343 [Minicystis rosea]